MRRLTQNPFGVVDYTDLTADEKKILCEYKRFNEENLKKRFQQREEGTLFKEIEFPKAEYVDPSIL